MRRPDYDDRTPPMGGLRGAVWLIGLLFAAMVVVTVVTGEAPELPDTSGQVGE